MLKNKILQGFAEKKQGVYYEYNPASTPVGVGGMGEVYKGYLVNQVTNTRKLVAIKVMKTDMDISVYKHAEREASIRLDNDNLVRMLAFLELQEADSIGVPQTRYYVVSEYLDGVVLTNLLQGNFKRSDGTEIGFARQLMTRYNKQRYETAVFIIQRVLAGIFALHDRGFIHRDIDPSNIMVTSEGKIKIIDFGIAKNVSTISRQDNQLTSAGVFIGKAAYAAPELVLGDIQHQGYVTDIYAIGILFFQLITGSLPFDGDQYSVLQMQLHKKLPLSKVKDVKLRSIIAKATEKKQQRRYQSCSEFRVALDEKWSPWKKLWSQFKYPLVACGILAVASVIALIVMNIIKTGPETIQTYYPVRDVFDDAYSNLSSDNPALVREGLDSMKVLADSHDYDSAKFEYALTYYPLGNASWAYGDLEKFKTSIESRQHKLGLNIRYNEGSANKYFGNIDNLDSFSIPQLFLVAYCAMIVDIEQDIQRAFDALERRIPEETDVEKRNDYQNRFNEMKEGWE